MDTGDSKAELTNVAKTSGLTVVDSPQKKEVGGNKAAKLTRQENVSNCCKGFWNYMWNSKEKTIMGRGCRKWSLLGAFIITSYITIAFIFLGLLCTVLSIIDHQRPQYYLMPDSPFRSSRIQRHPGIIFVPEADRETNADSPLIWISTKTKNHWGRQLGRYLKGHVKYNKKHCGSKDECFLLRDLDQPCKEHLYGWQRKHVAPSFAVRMTRLWGWKPEYFSSKSELLKEFKRWTDQNKQLADQEQKLIDTWQDTNGKSVIILCAGEKSTDAVLAGNITYCTDPYVDGKYFPFKNEKPYVSPFIVIQLQYAVRGIPITIECYPIAKNIEVSRLAANITGMDRFEILID